MLRKRHPSAPSPHPTGCPVFLLVFGITLKTGKLTRTAGVTGKIKKQNKGNVSVSAVSYRLGDVHFRHTPVAKVAYFTCKIYELFYPYIVFTDIKSEYVLLIAGLYNVVFRPQFSCLQLKLFYGVSGSQPQRLLTVKLKNNNNKAAQLTKFNCERLRL